MRKIKNALKTLFVFSLVLFSIIACDKDFTSIGTDVIGGNNFETNSFTYPVVAFNQKVDPVQTNTLPINLLGVFKDPAYGLSRSDFLAQLTPAASSPSFVLEPVVDSVFLTIPYYSTRVDLDEDGNSTYELDSIFGNAPFKLSCYRSNYFLRDFDPNTNFEENQNYYSNETDPTDGTISASLLEGDLIFQFDEFMVDNSEIILIGEADVETGETQVSQRLEPAIRIPLDSVYWKQTILDKKGEPELSNVANFVNYFRGLYFKAEAIGDDGTMMALDFTSSNNTNIVLYYSTDRETDDDADGIPNYADADKNGDGMLDNGTDTDADGINDTADVNVTGGIDADSDGIDDAVGTLSGSYTLNFNGNRVNLFTNEFSVALADGDMDNGDEKLYLKGGEGSMAAIDLFKGLVEEDGVQMPAFEHFENYFKNEADPESPKRLINEAHLIFYVDQNLVQGEEPDRIFLYDLDNNRPIIDYFLDPTTNNANPFSSIVQHLGPLERVDEEPDGQGIRYKIRMTEHLNNILIRDSTNVQLGLVVTGNVNIENGIEQLDLRNLATDDILDKIPLGSVITPRGTVLFGNNTLDESKKVKLEIFYTEPNN